MRARRVCEKIFQSTIEDLSDQKQEIVHYDFAYSLLKDGKMDHGLPFINQQQLPSDDGFLHY